MISIYDYLMMAIYFAFMIVIGIVFRNTSKDTSDYLRGGGSMTWWMTGASSFMVTFSAWTFVGCAGKIYKTGTLVISLFIFNAIAYLIVALFLAHRFRRMRVISPIDAVRNRFGPASEQVYAWQGTLMSFAFGGISLYTLAIFIAPIFQLDINLCIIIIGVAITFMSVTGGAWAVVASDFVQMLVIMTITVVAAVLVLNMPEVGGVSGFLDKMPSYHLDWTELARPQVIGLWLVGIFINQIASAINLTAGASRFLYVKSDGDAKKAALLTMTGFIVGPILWFIPPIAASFVLPDLATLFPDLNNPEEASYVAICMRIFPNGLIGLLACGIFAATMSAMDSGLNRTSGIFVRNIYKPLLRKDASEKELLLVARIGTLVLGGWMIVVGIWFSKLSQLPLFEWTLLIAGLISIPMTMPLVLGLFVRKAPGWSAWSSVIVGLATAYVMKYHVDPQWVLELVGLHEEVSKREIGDVQFALMVIGVSVVTSLWFFATRFFYDEAKEADKARTDAFFRDLDTPVGEDSDEHAHTDSLQYKTIGILCLAYGAFTFAGVLIPNPPGGRLCFIFCGGTIIAIGAWLYRLYLRGRRQSPEVTKME